MFFQNESEINEFNCQRNSKAFEQPGGRYTILYYTIILIMGLILNTLIYFYVFAGKSPLVDFSCVVDRWRFGASVCWNN